MTKELNPIYSCLASDFWTKRKCWRCQTFFTRLDYQTQNCQLAFIKIDQVKATTSLNQAVLAGVMVQLSHQSCCSGCLNYWQDLKKALLILTKNAPKKKTPPIKRNH